jgi:shikimate dehydrogenase
MEVAFKELGLNYRYIPFLVNPEDLETAIKALKSLHMKGTHITIPHKVDVLKYLDFISEGAELMGAVNTIYLRDGKTYGENTDGKGFITSLIENNVPIKGRRIVIFGAGGAARAMTVELAAAGAGFITVVNRTKARGQTLVDMLNDKTGVRAEYAAWEGPFSVPEETDIIINATSIGMDPDPNKLDIDYSTLLDRMIV